MESDDQVRRILEEIRDDQRELLDEYRLIAKQALELQSQAVARQESLGRLYRGALTVGAIITIAIIVLILWLLYVVLSYV